MKIYRSSFCVFSKADSKCFAYNASNSAYSRIYLKKE